MCAKKAAVVEPHRSLSVREHEVVNLAAEGRTDKEIAGEMGISAGTVRTYWNRLRTKLSVTTRAEAIAKVLKSASRTAIEEKNRQIRSLSQELSTLTIQAAQLAAAEASSRQIAEKLSEFALAFNQERKLIYASKGASACFADHVSTNEPAYRLPFVGDGAMKLDTAIETVLKTGSSETADLVCIAQEEPRHLHLSLFPRFDRSGDVTAVLAYADDVTTVKELEAFAFGMFDLAPVGLSQADGDNQIIRVNQKLSELLGYSMEELQTMNRDEFSAPEELELENRFIDEIRKGQRNGYIMRKCYVRADGTRVPAILVAFVTPGHHANLEWAFRMMIPLEEVEG